MFTHQRSSVVVLTALLSAIAYAAPVVRASSFAWQDTCGNQNWNACCAHPDGWYNNWFTTSIGGALDCPGPLPGFGDSVFLGGYTVYLDSVAFMSDLSSSGTFELRPGAPSWLAVDETATFEGVFYFDGGAITDGSFEIMYLLELRGAETKQLAAATLNVSPFAIARVTGGGDISMNSSHLNIWPTATFELRSDASLVNNPGQGGFDVINAGHLLKDGSAGVSRIEVPLYNTGVVDVRTGTLRVDAEDGTSSGAFIIEPGAVLEFAAHTLAPGATVVSDDTDGFVRIPQWGVLNLLAGAAPGIPHLRMDPDSHVRGLGELYVSLSLVWFGGFFEATGTVTLAGATGLTGAAAKGANTTTLVNAGTITWLDAGNLILAWAVLDNDGIFDVLTDADVEGGTINNAGVFTKAGTPGETTVGVFNNSGEVYARSGRLTLADFTQTDGKTVLDGGALGGWLEFLGGVLTGNGTIFGPVVNSGATVRPGLSPGSIVVDAVYTQTAAGRLEIEIGGTLPGVEYDQLITHSLAVLDGTIDISLIDGFVPDAGAEFELVTYPVHFGAFATVNLPVAGATRRFGLFYEPTRVVLRVGCAGDANCDLAVDFKDIDKFVEALSGQAAWEANPTNAGCPWLNADVNGDGGVTFKDIDAFVGALGSNCD